MLRIFGLGIMALSASILPACGGSGPAASCGKVQPCGGNVVGDWNLVATCETTAAINAGLANELMGTVCPTVTASNVSMSISGSLMFNADSTYSLSQQVGVAFDANIPASCSAALSCAMAEANLQAAIAAGDVISGSCAGTPCVCHEVLATTEAEAGTYATAGNALTLTSTAGPVSSVDYCIQGSTAHLMSVSMAMNMGTMGQFVINTDLVGQKQ